MTNLELVANVQADLVANKVVRNLRTQKYVVNVLNEAFEQVIKDTNCFERSKHGIVGANAPYLILPSDFIHPVYMHVAEDGKKLYLVNSGKISGTVSWTTSLLTFTVKDEHEKHNAELFLEATDKIHVTSDQSDISNPNDVAPEGEILVVGSVSDATATVVRNDGNGTAATNIATADTDKLNWTRVSPREITEVEPREYNQMQRWSSVSNTFYAIRGDRLFLRSSISSATAYELRYVAYPESGSAALPLISVSSAANKAASPAIKQEFHRAIHHLATALALGRMPGMGKEADRAQIRYDDLKNQIAWIYRRREIAGPVILNPEDVYPSE